MNVVTDALEATRTLGGAIEELGNELARLKQEVREWQAKAAEDNQRAAIYEQRSNEFEQKAARLDRVEEACGDLLEMLARLPLTTGELAMIPGARTEIALYASYDWQAVMNAKHALAEAMKPDAAS